MPDRYNKLRLELIIERPALRRAERVLESEGVKGWTVLPAISGWGGNTRWSRGTDISTATDMVMLVSIGGKDTLEPALEKLETLLGRHIGVLNVSDVRVLRPGKF